jgi:hypothetical protein
LQLVLPSSPEGIVSGGLLSQACLPWRIIEPMSLPLMASGIPLGLACATLCYWLVMDSVERFKKRRNGIRIVATEPKSLLMICLDLMDQFVPYRSCFGKQLS